MGVGAWQTMPDAERDWWRARQAQKDATHSGPGIPPHPRDGCDDPDHLWYPQMTVCRAEMELATAQARYERLHEKRPWHDGTFADWATEPDVDHPYHYRSGVQIWVAERDLALGGKFTTQANPYADDDEDEEEAHGHSL